MKIPRTLAAVAVAATVASSLAVAMPSAQAAPVYIDAGTQFQGYSGAGTFSDDAAPDCDSTTTSGIIAPVPVPENGAATTAATSTTATFIDNNNPADTATGTASLSATGSVASSAGLPTTMDFATTGTATVSDALAQSGCQRETYAEEDLQFDFTVQQAGILSLDMTNSGSGYGEVYIYQYQGPNAADVPYFDNYGRGLKFNTTSSVYLPVGEYRGYFEGQIGKYSSTSSTVSGTTSVHGSFNVAGAVTDQAQGKAAKYVKVGSRSCTTNTLSPQITQKGKKAKRIKKVTFFVNDHKVKKVSKIKKGKTYSLPATADERADLRIEVTLRPVKNQRPKTLDVEVGYEACS